jgi:hypothetical protein
MPRRDVKDLDAMNCPYCQAPLNVTEQPGAQPTVCPHCLSNLADPRTAPAGTAPNLLRDIRREGFRSSRARWVTIGISSIPWVVVGIGISIGLALIVPLMRQPRSLERVFGLAVGFVVLDVFVTIAAGMIAWRLFPLIKWPRKFEMIVEFVFLIAILAVAIVIFFFVVCNAVS